MGIYKAMDGDPYNHPYGGALHKSDTRIAAQHSIAPHCSELQERILGLLRGSPMTCDRIEALTGLRHQTCSARVRELAQSGAIYDTGARGKTRSGRAAIVWGVRK
jgi:hypothetical protein